MFQLSLTPIYRATVRFDVPAEDGQRLQCSFQAVFPRMTSDELEAFGKKAANEKWTDRQIAAQLLRGWGDDLRDAEGTPLLYTPANVALLLNQAGLGAAVVEAFRASQPKAALGN